MRAQRVSSRCAPTHRLPVCLVQVGALSSAGGVSAAMREGRWAWVAITRRPGLSGCDSVLTTYVNGTPTARHAHAHDAAHTIVPTSNACMQLCLTLAHARVRVPPPLPRVCPGKVCATVNLPSGKSQAAERKARLEAGKLSAAEQAAHAKENQRANAQGHGTKEKKLPPEYFLIHPHGIEITPLLQRARADASDIACGGAGAGGSDLSVLATPDVDMSSGPRDGSGGVFGFGAGHVDVSAVRTSLKYLRVETGAPCAAKRSPRACIARSSVRMF